MLKIKQFYDTALAQASYAIISSGKMAVVDPARDPQPYLQYAHEHQAQLVAIIETHSHADFVSSHLELHNITGATLYASAKTGAEYPHSTFDDGAEIELGHIRLRALNTPGHSPDSVSVLLIDSDGRQHSFFSGDTLLVGDVGRPDLREQEGDKETQRESMARQLYSTTRNTIMKLDREVLVYPAHGPGSLCAKNIRDELTSTIGRELEQNYALQQMSEQDFVNALLQDQPFVPKYFRSSVVLNKKGAPALQESINRISRLSAEDALDPNVLVVDTRDQLKFKNRHIAGAFNIINGPRFETWLGSILEPDEPFYLIAEDAGTLESLLLRAAKVGYEGNIKGAVVDPAPGTEHDLFIILEHFKAAPENYTIVDVRNEEEIKKGKVFEHAIPIPLHQLRERAKEVPTELPVVVHCAAGYRSAAGFSILEKELKGARIFDLGEGIKDFI